MPIPASAYANVLHLVPPAALKKPTAPARQAAAELAREAELRLKRKIDQANRVLDRLEARGIEQGIALKALQKRKAATLARIERIEDRALAEMSKASLDKASGIRYTFEARQNAASLLVDHDELVPKEFRRTIPESDAPDKVAMKAFLQKRTGETDADYEERTAALSAAVHLEQTVSLIRK
jgi:hypothetical protein